MVFLGDFIKASIVNEELEWTIFFVDKEDGGTMWGISRSNESSAKVFVNELPKGLKFWLRVNTFDPGKE